MADDVGALLASWRARPDPEAALSLCRALIGEPDRSLALDVGPEIAAHHGSDLEVMLSLGRLYMSAGELLRADSALKRSLEIASSDPRAWRLLGEVFLRAGNARDADTAFAGAVARGMTDAGTLTWLERARGYIALQDAAGAAAVAQRLDAALNAGSGDVPDRPSDPMAEMGGATLLAPSLNEEVTLHAPGLLSATGAMGRSVPDASQMMASPGRSAMEPAAPSATFVDRRPERESQVERDDGGPTAVRAHTPDLAALSEMSPTEVGLGPPGPPLSAPGGAGPESARTQVYTRPRVAPDSQPSATLLSPMPNPGTVPVQVIAAPGAPAPFEGGAPPAASFETGAAGRPSIDAPVAPAPQPGAFPAPAVAAAPPAGEVARPIAGAGVLDEMSMSIHFLKMPQSEREMDAYLDALRRSEGLDIDEPTHAQDVVPAPPGAEGGRIAASGTLLMPSVDVAQVRAQAAAMGRPVAASSPALPSVVVSAAAMPQTNAGPGAADPGANAYAPAAGFPAPAYTAPSGSFGVAPPGPGFGPAAAGAGPGGTFPMPPQNAGPAPLAPPKRGSAGALLVVVGVTLLLTFAVFAYLHFVRHAF